MIGRYAVVAGHIAEDLRDLERVIERVERSVMAATSNPDDRELFFDSAALNLHDFYSRLERIFGHIASGVDQSTPSGVDWHRELLRQMEIEIPGIRPAVLSPDLAGDIDEYLRFRHVVRHIYAFKLDSERIAELAGESRRVFEATRTALLGFVDYLQDLPD